MQSFFGGLTPDQGDIYVIEGTFPEIDKEEVRAPSKSSTSELEHGEVQFQRLIFTGGVDVDHSSQASGCFGCRWQTGEIFCYNSNQPSTSPLQTPTAKLKQKRFLGTDIMKSTYVLLSIFSNASTGEVVFKRSSAIALSPTTLVTAAHNLHYYQSAHDFLYSDWKLSSLRVYADEVANMDKLNTHGWRCEVLDYDFPEPRWGGLKECPTAGEDIAFLQVKRGPMLAFALPCSPAVGMDVICYGYMGSLEYLRKAHAELNKNGESDIWEAYWRSLSNYLKSLIGKLKGKYAEAERKAKEWLLKEILSVLWGIPEGAQIVSPGVVEATTPGYVAHSCSSLPGISGGALCPMDLPGYMIGCHSGSLKCNQNCATSADNRAFARRWFHFVLPSLPPPEWHFFCRSGFDIRPFKEWMVKNQRHIGVCQVSPWFSDLPLDPRLIEEELEERLKRYYWQHQPFMEQMQGSWEPKLKSRRLN